MLAPSRILRIARGSGHHPHEVMELLEQFKLMQTTMQKTMKKNKKMGKGGMCAAPLPRAAATRRPAAPPLRRLSPRPPPPTSAGRVGCGAGTCTTWTRRRWRR